MVIYPQLGALVAFFACLLMMVCACAVLGCQRLEQAVPLLCCSLWVLARSFTNDKAIEITLVWFGFLAGYILGGHVKHLRIVFIYILILEITYVALTRSRPFLFLSPGEYAGIGLMSLGLVPLPLSLLALLLTGTRSAWVTLIGVTYWRYKPRIAFTVTAAIALGLVFIRPETVQARLLVWREALGFILASPWIGHGAGAYYYLAQVQPYTQHADNIILTVLVEFGVIGLALFAWLFYKIIRRMRGVRPLQVLGLAAVMLMQLFDQSLYFIPGGILFGLCLSGVLNGQLHPQVLARAGLHPVHAGAGHALP